MADTVTTFQNFRWGDVQILADLQKANTAALERWLRQPNLEPERDCVLAYSGNKPVGYAYLMIETAISRGVLISGVADGEGSSVIRALQKYASVSAHTLGLKVLHVDIPEADLVARLLYEESGMRHIRTHHHMRREIVSRVVFTMPKGATLRLADRNDVGSITRLQNAAFTGSWGYSPNTEGEIEYRIFDLPTNSPDPVVLLEIDGSVMAYCWTHHETPTSPGIVGMVGVWPDQQGKGYGNMVTGAGINHLLRMGANPIEITVDSENLPAIRVYQKVGFVLGWKSFWYELALR